MAGMLIGDDNPLSALIGKSAAEKALQPWWESIEDLLIYALIGFGKYVVLYVYDSNSFLLIYSP